MGTFISPRERIPRLELLESSSLPARILIGMNGFMLIATAQTATPVIFRHSVEY